MHSKTRLRSFVLALPFLVAGAAAACGGGDDSSVATGDGGSDALVGGDTSSGDGASQDTGSGDDASSDAGSAFCRALASFDQRCARTDACSQAELALYDANAAALSPGVQQAEATCRDQEPCPGGDSGAKKSYDTCLAEAIAALPETSAQTKLAQDACALCAPDAGNCVKNFYREGDAGKPGPGADLVVYSDAVLSDVDTSCFGPDAGACPLGSGCVKKAIDRHLPQRPLACKTDADDAATD